MTQSDVLTTHDPITGQCPGLDCDNSWHINGCGPMWQMIDAHGYELHGGLYDEDDAVERRRWDGPDGPDLIEYRRSGVWEEA